MQIQLIQMHRLSSLYRRRCCRLTARLHISFTIFNISPYTKLNIPGENLHQKMKKERDIQSEEEKKNDPTHSSSERDLRLLIVDFLNDHTKCLCDLSKAFCFPFLFISLSLCVLAFVRAFQVTFFHYYSYADSAWPRHYGIMFVVSNSSSKM